MPCQYFTPVSFLQLRLGGLCECTRSDQGSRVGSCPVVEQTQPACVSKPKHACRPASATSRTAVKPTSTFAFYMLLRVDCDQRVESSCSKNCAASCLSVCFMRLGCRAAREGTRSWVSWLVCSCRLPLRQVDEDLLQGGLAEGVLLNAQRLPLRLHLCSTAQVIEEATPEKGSRRSLWVRLARRRQMRAAVSQCQVQPHNEGHELGGPTDAQAVVPRRAPVRTGWGCPATAAAG